MNIDRIPEEIRRYTEGRAFAKDEIGCSSAGVYRLTGPGDAYWLKVDASGGGLRREAEVLRWCKGRLNVPDVIGFTSSDGLDWLLMTDMPGVMACSPEAQAKPEQTVRLLAEGLKMIQVVDISKCPFDARLSRMLEQAEKNIKAGLVDSSDWEPDTVHSTPEELLRYLREFRPADEELAFTHGDYCLPNIFFEGSAVCGFIDMGRAGVADRWQDIALCIRSLHHNFQTDAFDSLLLEALGTEPNREKIEYYILLDELF